VNEVDYLAEALRSEPLLSRYNGTAPSADQVMAELGEFGDVRIVTTGHEAHPVVWCMVEQSLSGPAIGKGPDVLCAALDCMGVLLALLERDIDRGMSAFAALLHEAEHPTPEIGP
jgi:hypothetical protein